MLAKKAGITKLFNIEMWWSVEVVRIVKLYTAFVVYFQRQSGQSGNIQEDEIRQMQMNCVQ